MFLREINSTLKPLIEEIRRARMLDMKISSLEKQLTLARRKLSELDAKLRKEQNDVVKLNGRFIPVTTSRMIREEKEMQEAQHAYDAALAMTQHLNRLLKSTKYQRSLFGKPEKLMEELINIKEQTMLNHQHPSTNLLQKIEEKILHLECEQREVKEAIEASMAALTRIEHLYRYLDRLNGVDYSPRIFQYRNRSVTEKRIENAVYEVHLANHKLLQELVDLKRKYSISQGHRMEHFHTIFITELANNGEDFHEQMERGIWLCKTQSQIIKSVQQSLFVHQKQLKTQIGMERTSQKNIIKHA
ncbi:MAG: hypothetical protein AAFY71_14790 [Bacteroidota bacterium]